MTRTLSMIPADTMMIARVPAVPSIFVPRFGCVLMRRRMTTSQPVNSMASARVDAVPSVSAAKICSGVPLEVILERLFENDLQDI